MTPPTRHPFSLRKASISNSDSDIWRHKSFATIATSTKFSSSSSAGAQGAAVERHQHAFFARGLGVIERGVAHMAVEMQQFRAGKIEAREGLEIGVVAGAKYRALAVVGKHEGQRASRHAARVDAQAIGRRHIQEHVREPVPRDGDQQIGRLAELGAGEGSGRGIAAKGHRIVLGDGLFVAVGQGVGDHADVDIGVTDEQRVQVFAPR